VEGLRALAVLVVVAYHAGLPLTGGFVGVDVFFVVSGFLITSLLLRDGATGSFSLKEFWARRVRRLLPASTLVVAFTALAGLWSLESSRVRTLAGDVVSAATFSSNFRFASTTDYLAGVSLPSPLLHFWSLAVEEQFYLVWPLLFVAAFRFSRPRRVLLTFAVVLAVVSFAFSVMASGSDPSTAYYLLPSRAWELLAGALLAFLPTGSFTASSAVLRAARSFAAFVSVAALLVACFVFGSDTIFPGVAATLPVAATALLLVVLPGTFLGSVFSSASFRWIGARSYSLYLWHWPLLVLAEARFGILSAPATWLCVLFSVLLAELTFRFVEDPTRRSRLLAARPSLSLAAGGCLASVTLVCGALLVFAAPAGSSVTLTANVPASPAVDPVVSSPSVPPSSGGPVPTVAPSTVPTLPVVDLGRVLLVGDSTLAPLRWFESGRLGLSGFDFHLDAESCRRIMLASCEGRERRTPESVTALIDGFTASGDRYDTIVLMGGYHAYEDTIIKEFRGFVSSARAHGAERIIVLDWRESLAFPARGSRGEVSVYTRFNELIRGELAGGGYDDVVLLNWHGYTAARPEWFRSDGIHVNLSGTLVLGEFISDSLAALANRPCPGAVSGPACVVPEVAVPRDVLAEYGVPDTDMHCYEYGSSREPGCRKDKLA